MSGPKSSPDTLAGGTFRWKHVIDHSGVATSLAQVPFHIGVRRNRFRVCRPSYLHGGVTHCIERSHLRMNGAEKAVRSAATNQVRPMTATRMATMGAV